MLQNISFGIEAKELTFFVSKIVSKAPASVKSKEIDLVLSLGRKTSKTDEALMENQARIIAFLWNYLFDEASSTYLDQSVAMNALNATSELLRLSSVEIILQYFQRLVDNIGRNFKGYFSITIAAKFVKHYISKAELSKEVMIDRFQSDFKLLDLLIDELSNYMSQVKEKLAEDEAGGKQLDVARLSNSVFQDLFPHSSQLTDRMDFIKEFAKGGSFSLTHS